MSGAMVIAVWVQILGGSGGGWSTLARPSRGDSEAWRSGQISPGWRAGGRAGQPLVAVGVGAVFALELVGAAGGDLLVVQVAGDGVVAQAGGGGDQRPGQGGAVPGALDEDGAAGIGLDAELVYPVVHDRPVAQGAGGQLESPGQRGGVGAVVAEPAGLVPAGGDGGQDPGAGAAGVFAGPGQRQADGQIGMRGRRAGRPGHGGDGGLQRPADLAQRLALVVLAFAVVAFADVPAAVGVAGAQAGALGRAAGEQRDRGGVQAGAAVERRAFVVGQDGDAGLEQRVEERLQPAAGSFGLAGGHRPGAGVEVRLAQPPVLRQRRGVHDRADGAEAVADPAVGGQERPLGGDGAGDAEQAAGRAADSWQNSSRVASVRNSGRSSRARHSSAVSTARTGSGRGRPVRWASAASMTGALPLRSISSAAKATVCVADAAAGGGQGQAGAAHRRALRAPAGPQGALGGADARRRGGRSGPATRPRRSR